MTNDGETKVLEFLKRIAEAAEKLVELGQHSQATAALDKIASADTSGQAPGLLGKLTKKGK